MMETYLEKNSAQIALAAPIAPTLGQLQNAVALQAFGGTAAGALQDHPDRLSGQLSLTAAASRRFLSRSIASGDDGLRELDRIGCPYCRRRTYLVRVQPLGNLLALTGRCATCGTNGRQLMER